jgi:lysozyme
VSAKKTVAWVSICTGLCAGAEGIRQMAYYDVGGVPTICFGETRGVKMGDRKTVEECKAMLEGRLYEFAREVEACTTVELPPARMAGFVDFSYNVGSGTYCTKFAPLLNEGKVQAACDKLLLYVKAGGVTFPGLVKRRQAEWKLCMEGVV